MNWLEHQLLWGSLELGLVAIFVALLARVAGRRRVRLAALLWTLVFVKACIVFVPTADWQLGPSVRVADGVGTETGGPMVANGSLRVMADSDGVANRSPQPSPDVLSGPRPEVRTWISWSISGLWILGGLCVFAWHFLGWYRITRLRRPAGPVPGFLCRLYAEEARRCRVRRPPDLVVHPLNLGPLVTGGFRPLLVLPTWLIEETNRSDLRWVLRHELMHVRHLDHLGLILRSVAEVLFWFHPAIWWAGREWRRKMEQACDDAVVADEPEAMRYASTLLRLLEKMRGLNHRLVPVAGLYATRTVIGQRIQRLLQRGDNVPLKWGPFGYLIWGLGAACVVLFGFRSVGAEPSDTRAARSTLRIDLGPEGQKVEPGWEGWSEDRDRDFVCGFDLDFEIEIDRGPAWRDGGAIEPGARLNALFRDGLRERDDEEIRILIKDLDPGDYLLELFSYTQGKKSKPSAGRFDLVINGSVLLEDQITSEGGSTTGASLPPVPLVSDGDEVEVVLKRKQGDIWLNGFVLSGRTRWSGDLKLGKIKLTEAPPEVQATIEREIKDASLDDVRRKVRNDALVYSIDADTPVGDLELEIAADGSVLERTEEISPASLPPAVTRAVAAVGESVEVRKVRLVARDNLESIEVEIRMDGDRERLIFDHEGRLLSRNEDD